MAGTLSFSVSHLTHCCFTKNAIEKRIKKVAAQEGVKLPAKLNMEGYYYLVHPAPGGRIRIKWTTKAQKDLYMRVIQDYYGLPWRRS